jgi:hypothetical protein
MEALPEFCARVLGGGDGAMQAAEEARDRAPGGDRVALLAAALAACRAREPAQVPAPSQAAETDGLAQVPAPSQAAETDGLAQVPAPSQAAETDGLAQAVAGELTVANARLPQRQREALALRELLGLSHDQIARVIGIDAHAVAPLLARARLRFRALLRGSVAAAPSCDERERSLRTIARRQDSEPVDEGETAWLMEHLGHCRACTQSHAAMLEASVCYRAWRVQADGRPGVEGGKPAAGQ